MVHVVLEFYKEVIPSYTDYASKRLLNISGDDLRLAMAATSQVAHFRESLPQPYSDKDRIKTLCPDWYILSETNDAYKHKVRNKNRNKILVASIHDIKAVEVVTDYVDDKGTYTHHEIEVDVFLIDGKHRDVFELLTNVVNFYFQTLFELGLVDEPLRFHPKKTSYVSRAEAKPSPPAQLAVTPRTPMFIEYRHQRFNYTTGQIDLYDPNEFQITRTLFEIDKQRNFRTYAWTPEGSDSPPQIYVRLTPEA